MSLTFSIVIPSYNDIRILETLSSINSQNYDRNLVEIVVQDGGSSPEIIEEIKKLLNPHDRLIIEKDNGIFDAINRGLVNSNNDYILTLGTDDRIHNNQVLSEISDEISDWDYINFSINYTDKNWNPVRKWYATPISFLNFILGHQVPHFGFICKQDVYKKLRFFNTHYDVSADFNFFLKLSKEKAFKGRHSKKIIVDMKLGGNSSKDFKNVLKGNMQMFSSGFKKMGILILFHFIFKPLWKIKQFLNARFT